jgi:hypothetical protein
MLSAFIAGSWKDNAYRRDEDNCLMMNFSRIYYKFLERRMLMVGLVKGATDNSAT